MKNSLTLLLLIMFSSVIRNNIYCLDRSEFDKKYATEISTLESLGYKKEIINIKFELDSLLEQNIFMLQIYEKTCLSKSCHDLKLLKTSKPNESISLSFENKPNNLLFIKVCHTANLSPSPIGQVWIHQPEPQKTYTIMLSLKKLDKLQPFSSNGVCRNPLPSYDNVYCYLIH